MTARRIPWLRLAAEALLIVVSILLAFGIDAWWDARQDRVAELRVLRNLRDEFVQTRDLLRTSIEWHRDCGEGAVRLSRWEGLNDDTDPAEVASWVPVHVASLPDLSSQERSAGRPSGFRSAGLDFGR